MCFLHLLCPMYPTLHPTETVLKKTFLCFLGKTWPHYARPSLLSYQQFLALLLTFWNIFFWASMTLSSTDAALVDWRILIISQPSNFFWLYRYQSLVSSSSASIPFSRQPYLHMQTLVSLLWQWLTNLLQTCFLLSRIKISCSAFGIYSLVVSPHLKLTMNF